MRLHAMCVICVCVCKCVQVGGDKRMEGVMTPLLVALDLPNIVSNNYLIKGIST